jgi:hypothetical protein
MKFGAHVRCGGIGSLANAHEHTELGGSDAVGSKGVVENTGDKPMQPGTSQGRAFVADGKTEVM